MRKSLSFCVVALLCAFPAALVAGNLEIHGIALESHGDSILIKTPSGKHLLIDAGMRAAGPALIEYLQKVGVKQIDLLLLTHSDPDHIGAMEQVARRFPVKLFWAPSYPQKKRSYRGLIKYLKSKQVPIKRMKRGQKLELEKDLRLEVLWPAKPYIADAKSNINANSLLIRLTYKKLRVLLTGDIEKETEARLLKDGVDLRCDILKIAHHGSKTSSTAAFLKATGAKTALIICEKESPLGHPRPQVLARLRTAGMDWYRTDVNGNIVITCRSADPRRYEVTLDQGKKDDTSVNKVNPAAAVRNFLKGRVGKRRGKKKTPK